jgi:hypothetical protein
VDGQILTFSQAEETTIIDSETGTTWNGLTGESLSGPLTGTTLSRKKSASSFWFGWKDWYPDSEIYGLDN